MSRRKVRGLTRTGRQVSEDPDLDNLLSALSPEEMEELDKDLRNVPDIGPEDGKIIVTQGESRPAQSFPSNDVQDTARRSDIRGRLSQREQSLEVGGAKALKWDIHGFHVNHTLCISAHRAK